MTGTPCRAPDPGRGSLVTTHASTGGWVAAATPALIALVGVLVIRECLSASGWLGIALATVGVLVDCGY